MRDVVKGITRPESHFRTKHNECGTLINNQDLKRWQQTEIVHVSGTLAMFSVARWLMAGQRVSSL